MEQVGSDIHMDMEFDETHDVAIIPPEDEVHEVAPEAEPRADDTDAMKKRFMPDLPDQEVEVEAEAVDVWEIKDWKSLNRREQGPVFLCAGHPWRVLFFPHGNNVESASFYLEQGFGDKAPPEDWYACVQFMLVLWNPNDPSIYVTHTANHRFTADDGDWGFTRFAELRKLFASRWEDKDRPLVEDNCANVTAYVKVLKDPTGVLWHNFVNYDSKKETGMVGLKNQGATCYLNSLLQSLYFTNSFRKAVYQIPTESAADTKENSAYALQRLFYQLQTNRNALSTQELTAAFGWTSSQIFDQQDVQELSRVLMERLEERMKNTEAENALARMFAGKMKTYISCINVDYESSRIEDFWDIQLNVRGNKNLDDSFKDYVQVETMDGENKYFAEGHGLQDARKGVIFESFPQILHLQLKRFEYDLNRDAMMKVNDRYEFPEVWDASPYLSENADRSESYVYHLHGVLVHSGEINTGHYYAFLKPKRNGDFFRFDDERVTRATRREALEENYGGDYANLSNGNIGQRNPYTRTWSDKRSMSAYMLVYLRETRLDTTLVEELDPPAHLAQRVAEERAHFEKQRKEQEEAHLYMEVQVATNDNFKAHQGFDVAAWKSDHTSPATPKAYRVLRSMTINDLLSLLAHELKVDPELCRPWLMVGRQNGTVRPDQPIEGLDLTCEEVTLKSGSKVPPLRLWLEQTTERDEAGSVIWNDVHLERNATTSNKPILLLLKHFNPDEQSLCGVTHFYASWQDKVADLYNPIVQLLGWPSGTSIKLYEEIRHNMIEAMKPKVSLRESEVQDGDIITVQKSLNEKELASLTQSGRCAEVKDFYEYLLNRTRIHFLPKYAPPDEENSFTLDLSKRMTYDQFASKVGERLGVDPTHLRFTTVHAASGKPKAPVRRATINVLAHIMSSTLNYSNTRDQKSDALFYEVLEMSLSELETRKNVKLTWLSEGITKEENFEMLVEKTGTLSDLIPQLQKKIGFSDDDAQYVRLYEAHAQRIIKVLAENFPVLSLNEYTTLYAELIPEEERDTDDLIACYHFDKEANKAHNIPFILRTYEGELFKDTKERISARTGIKGAQLQKIRFAIIRRGGYTRPDYLDDNDIIKQEMTADDYLGLDHVNRSRNTALRGDSIFIR